MADRPSRSKAEKSANQMAPWCSLPAAGPLFSIVLPYPPSANRLWKFRGGRRPYKSKQYTDWTNKVLILCLGKKKFISGHYHIMIEAGRPDRRRRDLGNLEKPISDAMQEAGVVGDDCLALSIMSVWEESMEKKGVRVSIWPAQ